MGGIIMKRILALLLTFIMLFALAGCSSKEAASTETTTEATTETEASTEAETTTEVVAATDATTIDMSGVKLMNDGKLTIGVEIGYPPFEDFAEDGTTPIGYDIDFGYALAEKLGLEVLHINTAWDGIFQGIDSNYDIVISAVTITDERKETMSFSDPYINNYQAVVVAKDYAGQITGFNDLEGLSLAVQKETTSDVLMSDYIATGSITATISANEKVTTCFTQLENGEVDAVVVDSTVADGYVASNPDKFMIAYLDDSEAEQFGVALGKDNTALQTAINEAIAELTEEGFFAENVEHWFGSSN
jgi:polar amino acid transport system substrate-binding protein